MRVGHSVIPHFDEDRAKNALRTLLDDERTDPNAMDSNGRRPLALVDRNPVFQRILLADERLDLRQPVVKNGDTAIFIAARLQVWSAVQRYVTSFGLPAGTDQDTEGNTVLHHLTARSAPRELLHDRIGEVTKAQLNASNKAGNTPFHGALIAGNWPLADRMLATGLLDLHESENALKWELLVAVGQEAPQELISALVERIRDRISRCDSDGWTVLHHLCAIAHRPWLERLKEALSVNELWNVKDPQGRRPVDLGGKALDGIAPDGLAPQPWPEGRNWDTSVSWKTLDAGESAAFIARAGLEGVDAENFQVARGALAFYPGQTIARIRFSHGDRTRPVYYFLDTGDDLSRLNGTSPPIHAFNTEHLKLSADTVADYLRFFCFFVRGDDGPYYLLEDPDAVTLTSGTTSKDRRAIAALACPVWLIASSEKSYRLVARVFYGNALFSAYFSVAQTGVPTMEEDFSLLSELSGQVDMPIA